jgi:penicillin-binding protein 1C
VVSTIDADLQARLEPMAAAVAATQGPDVTAAILVVEIKGRAVRALVGSAGRDRPGGWIDLTRAIRSPGSALKPFIYAFAFDDGAWRPTPRSTTPPPASPTTSPRTSTTCSTTRSRCARPWPIR